MKHGARIAFVIREIGLDGVSKMAVHYANIACEIFDYVHIIVIGEELIDNLVDHEKIKVDVIGRCGSRKNKVEAVLKDVYALKRKIEEIKPDILFPFTSGEICFTYLAVRNKYFMIGAERGNPERIKPIVKKMCKCIYKKMDYMFFQSQGAADFYSLNKDMYSVVPNPCVVPNEYANYKHVRRNKRKIIIVSTSRLAPEKNIDVAIKAVNSCRSRERVLFSIYGDGVLRNDLERLVDEIGANDIVSFNGNTQNPLEAIASSDIFILISSGEGMPNALIEAMSMGVPCISTNCMANNTNSLIVDGVNGIIVDKRDVIAIGDAIDKLIEEESLYESISSEAIKIRDTLAEEKINYIIKKDYEELMVRYRLKRKKYIHEK